MDLVLHVKSDAAPAALRDAVHDVLGTGVATLFAGGGQPMALCDVLTRLADAPAAVGLFVDLVNAEAAALLASPAALVKGVAAPATRMPTCGSWAVKLDAAALKPAARHAATTWLRQLHTRGWAETAPLMHGGGDDPVMLNEDALRLWYAAVDFAAKLLRPTASVMAAHGVALFAPPGAEPRAFVPRMQAVVPTRLGGATPAAGAPVAVVSPAITPAGLYVLCTALDEFPVSVVPLPPAAAPEDASGHDGATGAKRARLAQLDDK
jgi:hypothetical protein